MRFLDQLQMYILHVFWEQRTYRTAVVLGGITTAISLLQFALLGVFIQQGNSFPGIADYGGNVLGFLISGSIFTGFVTICLSGFSGYIKSEQQAGTLESVASHPTPLTRTMWFSAIIGLIGTVAGSTLMIVLFSFVFDIPFSINLPGLVLVLLALVAALGGFGLAGCGVLLVTKKGDPITWVFVTATTLLSGVMYPVSILPGWVQAISNALPTTSALHGLRMSVLQEAGISSIAPTVGVLAMWAAASIPLGIIVFRMGLRRSRSEGTMAEH